MQTAGNRVSRHDAIRSYLYAHGFSDVQALTAALGASAATIRRDLQELEQQGVIDRVHGGARIAEGTTVEVAFEQRARRDVAAKQAIAALAYAGLTPHSAIFLDAGTTVLQLARLIRLTPLPLRVFTNGLLVAQELLHVPDIELTLIGGQLRRENASATGPEAEAMLDRLWFDRLFLGASAIGRDGGIYSVDSTEASLNRVMLKRAGAATLLVDSTKFGASATYRVGALTDLAVITDDRLSPTWRQLLNQQQVAISFATMDTPS